MPDDQIPTSARADAGEVLAAPQTRRRLLGRAAAGVTAAGGAATLLGGATAAASGDAPARVLSFIATQEGFGVTFLTEAVRRAGHAVGAVRRRAQGREHRRV